MTLDELYERIENGAKGEIQLPTEDAATVQKILIDNGYAVLATGGDITGKTKLQWVYAGTPENLDYADSHNVVFASADYLEMLKFGDYDDDSRLSSTD